MSSTSFNVGVAGETKPSSRVLKPPGGGHSDIFGSSDVRQNPPRPKNNQQNSSNMNAVMGTMDPNESLDTSRRGGASAADAHPSAADSAPSAQNGPAASNGGGSGDGGKPMSGSSDRARVPPGGHSQGFW